MVLARRRTSWRKSRGFRAAKFSPSRGGAIRKRRHSPNHWARSGREIPKLLPPEQLDAAIIFAPVGALVPLALKAVAKGGTVVCGGIHMSDIPSFPYDLLWEERTLCSVANLTRRDGEEFFALAPRVPVRTTVQTFPLAEANEALCAFAQRQTPGRRRAGAVN